MDTTTQAIIVSLAANYFTHFTAPVLQDLFDKVFRIKPGIENDLRAAKSPQDFEKIFREAVGVIDANAGTGSIEVDGSLLEAIRGIRFDHQDGHVSIVGSRLSANVLQTGGSGSGQTFMTDSVLKSKNSEMKIGKGASITINGDGQIRQS